MCLLIFKVARLYYTPRKGEADIFFVLGNDTTIQQSKKNYNLLRFVKLGILNKITEYLYACSYSSKG